MFCHEGLYLVCLIFSLVLYQNQLKQPNTIFIMKKKNTISLATAKEWAKNWRELESDYNKYNECRAFNIPKIDLQEVLTEEGVASIRAYIGVKETKNNKTGKTVYEEKLMIVGVDKNNKDMISTVKSTELGDGEDDDIYDFTDPCPHVCDPDSPLNG